MNLIGMYCVYKKENWLITDIVGTQVTIHLSGKTKKVHLSSVTLLLNTN